MVQKKKTKKTIEKEILDLTISYSIDLWLFKQCIIDLKKEYEWYIIYWDEFTRTKLTETDFNKLIDLLERYMKKND